jgi:hypothetical protein
MLPTHAEVLNLARSAHLTLMETQVLAVKLQVS